MWIGRDIQLDPLPRGFHLVTREVVAALPELGELSVGLLHVHVRHTSASLTLNENASPDVRDGGLALGTWQGIYLCEPRDRGGPCSLTLTLHGE